MEPFDFDKCIDRFDMHSLKWDVKKGELPMWVADMDFATVPAVVEALKKRVEQNVFGYNIITQDFATSFINWWHKRHNFKMKPQWILFCTGVVPAISSIVRKVTNANENVVVLAPVYNIFYNSIINNKRQVLASNLLYKDGKYDIDWSSLEEKLAQKSTSLFIFCNPHNPIGMIWSKDTLRRIGELCVKHNVILLSDEIHCDLTHKGATYTPMASISKEIAQQTIMCIAPTKTFNLAGLQTSAIVVPNPELRKLVERGINTDEVAEPNTFAIQAAVAAFTYGEPWLEALTDYLECNRQILIKTVQEAFPIHIVQSQATYLAWLDCSKITQDTNDLCQYIREKTGLYLSAGEIFGGNGKQFIRWNYACPKSKLEDGIKRFIEAVSAFLNQKI